MTSVSNRFTRLKVCLSSAHSSVLAKPFTLTQTNSLSWPFTLLYSDVYKGICSD